MFSGRLYTAYFFIYTPFDYTSFEYSGTYWARSSTVWTGGNNVTCLAIGDLNHDGVNELYASNADGNIYQIRWTGAFWVSSSITTASLFVNKIAIGDGDDEGLNKLYTAGQDGHFYQFKWISSDWQQTDLGNAATPLICLAVGDGDNDGQSEVYGIGANRHLYQAKAVSVSANLTPTATPAEQIMNMIKIRNSQINPLRGEKAAIRWFQAKKGPVTIKIFNLMGNQMCTLVDHVEYANEGIHEVFWDGFQQNGRVVGSGIYIVYISAPGFSNSAKIAVVK